MADHHPPPTLRRVSTGTAVATGPSGRLATSRRLRPSRDLITYGLGAGIRDPCRQMIPLQIICQRFCCVRFARRHE